LLALRRRYVQVSRAKVVERDCVISVGIDLRDRRFVERDRSVVENSTLESLPLAPSPRLVQQGRHRCIVLSRICNGPDYVAPAADGEYRRIEPATGMKYLRAVHAKFGLGGGGLTTPRLAEAF
jgi:hypothetical protein